MKMFKNIILSIYIILIAIAITVSTLSNHVTETGVIEFGNNVLIEAESNILKPTIVKGDLVISDKSDKKVKIKDIISYVTLEDGNTIIRTNEIVAITKDSNGKNIYSLKKEGGTIENIDDSCILGTYKTTIPLVGTIMTYLLTQQGFYTVVLIPSIILTIVLLIDFLLDLKKRRKQ